MNIDVRDEVIERACQAYFVGNVRKPWPWRDTQALDEPDAVFAAMRLALVAALEKLAGTGVGLILAERQRQITAEGYTPERDAKTYAQVPDGHYAAELPCAAAAYACFAGMIADFRDLQRTQERPEHQPPSCWPWSATSWKPGADNSNASRIRELEKAGALIAAEIDRLLSASEGA
ncbi:hypothetical protein DyAD56_16100 [Dyella sp. AD56]|uniref:hypothetical protein n=1 Tax=Dyella sp. AD56 TaxID=1528744 RepID=UPI000CB76993|nr:hypothetical protein [Dyella sp. AD56]PMQ04211.1 hypothetical protein DyAD56_16100 [Dyella sp. AD56]